MLTREGAAWGQTSLGPSQAGDRTCMARIVSLSPEEKLLTPAHSRHLHSCWPSVSTQDLSPTMAPKAGRDYYSHLTDRKADDCSKVIWSLDYGAVTQTQVSQLQSQHSSLYPIVPQEQIHNCM